MIEPQLVPRADNALPAGLQERVNRELAPSEHVLWSTQPIPGRAALRSLPVVLFGIPWTLFSVFWMFMALRGTGRGDAASMVFPLFGLPFVAIGIGMLASPVGSFRAAKRCVYVLTNRRAIIFQSTWRGAVKVRSFEASRLGELRRVERDDGTGDVVFTQDVATGNRGSQRMVDVGFLDIQSVKGVEDRVRALVSDRPRETY